MVRRRFDGAKRVCKNFISVIMRGDVECVFG